MRFPLIKIALPSSVPGFARAALKTPEHDRPQINTDKHGLKEA